MVILYILFLLIGISPFIIRLEPFTNLFKNNEKVVVLDIDDTLFVNDKFSRFTVYNQYVNVNAINIIKECVKRNYKIAILTARSLHGAEIAVPVIKKIFDECGYKYDEYFFDLSSPYSGFQYGYLLNKEAGMENLQNIYGTKRRNMILFDDNNHHINNVLKAGFHAERSCSEKSCLFGITREAMENGMKKIQ